jgi:hypothetical protein
MGLDRHLLFYWFLNSRMRYTQSGKESYMHISLPATARAASLGVLCILLACGGSNTVSPPTTIVTPPPTTLAPAALADLSASVTSPENGHTFGCRDDAHFLLKVTNRSAFSVDVPGVARHTAVMRGDCGSSPDYTYQVRATALPHATTNIVDRPVYGNGTGCCIGGPDCSGQCTFKDTFTAVTALGDVPAGSIQYQVIFGHCGKCSSLGAAGGAVCRQVTH